jgi:hypothetical protein
VFNEVGCYDSASVAVKVFKTNPYVFVPSAFTPNGDGLNDVIRPIAVGVQQIKYFRIFNRLGANDFQHHSQPERVGRIDKRYTTGNVMYLCGWLTQLTIPVNLFS